MANTASRAKIVQRWASERIGVFVAIVVVACATLAVGVFLNSDSNSRAVGAAQANAAQTNTQTIASNNEDMEITTMVETFDLPGQPTGVRTLPMLASVLTPSDLNWGVAAGIGVGGTNAWQASYVTQSSMGLALPTRVNLRALSIDEDIIISMDAWTGTPNCGSGVGAGLGSCNEAYVGLSDPNQSGWNPWRPNSIVFGGATTGWNHFDMNEAMAADGRPICEQAGGQFEIVQSAGNRCRFAPVNPLPTFPVIDGLFFRIDVRFRVLDGNLVASFSYDGNFVAEYNLGSVTLRPWWGSMQPTYWIDDRGDNLTIEQRRPRPPAPPTIIETNTCYDED